MPDLPTGTVTLLFTDIEGSTNLLQRLGGEQYAAVLSEQRDLLRNAFHAFEGHEVDTQGDAFFVAFSRASDAVSAAVAAQRALFTHTWPEGVTVWVRMGLHTGEPVLASEGYVGLDVHHAARIMSAAHGGQVLLSQTIRELVEHTLPEGIAFLDLGEHRLKDLQRASHLFQLVIVGLPTDFPALKTLGAFPNNLPVQPTAFLGREKEIAAALRLLMQENIHLLTLTGPGGTGKTRLALQVAAEASDHFAHGVFFVDLAPLSDPALVVPTIAQVLNVTERGGQPLLENLKTSLREKQMLLLLDNFEQVVQAAPAFADLLAACPKLKILVTSRMALHLRAEQEFAVTPLALPDPKHLPVLIVLSQYEAVALFIQRARAVKSDFQVTNATAPAVAEICVRLDGLPLAIELAAARIKLFPPQALLDRLGQPLAVLTTGALDAPSRQQTLRKTIQWSYDLLDAHEQRLFRLLSVFVGGCTYEAIEVVSTTLDTDSVAGKTLDVVASLIDKSLLQQTEHDSNEPRLVMLETIREYGLEALALSGENEITSQAHALYYLTLAEVAEPKLAGPHQAIWFERLGQELDNLRAALVWCLERGEVGHNIEIALRLAAALWWFWEVRVHWSEGLDFLERALAGGEDVAAPLQVKALKATAHLTYTRSDFDRAEALSEECLALCHELGDTEGIALSHRLLGCIASRKCNFVVACSLTEESLALFRELGDKEGIAWSLHNLSDNISIQGEYAKAISLEEESLALFRELGHKMGIAWSLLQFADVLIISQGDPSKIHTLLEESLAICRETGDKEGLAYGLRLLGEVSLQQGDAGTARSLLEESLVLAREMGMRWSIAWSLIVLGRVAACEGDYTTAYTLYKEIPVIGRKMGNNRQIAYSLEGLADVATVQREFLWAARLWGSAEILREAMGAPIPPVYRAAYQRSVAAARAQLGEQAFNIAWAEGRNMTPEQVIDMKGPAKASIPTFEGHPSTNIGKTSPRHPAGMEGGY